MNIKANLVVNIKNRFKNLIRANSKKYKIFLVIKIKKKPKRKKRFIPDDFNYIENFKTNYESKTCFENMDIKKYKKEFYNNKNEISENDKFINDDEFFKNIMNIETNQKRNQNN